MKIIRYDTIEEFNVDSKAEYFNIHLLLFQVLWWWRRRCILLCNWCRRHFLRCSKRHEPTLLQLMASCWH